MPFTIDVPRVQTLIGFLILNWSCNPPLMNFDVWSNQISSWSNGIHNHRIESSRMLWVVGLIDRSFFKYDPFLVLGNVYKQQTSIHPPVIILSEVQVASYRKNWDDHYTTHKFQGLFLIQTERYSQTELEEIRSREKSKPAVHGKFINHLFYLLRTLTAKETIVWSSSEKGCFSLQIISFTFLLTQTNVFLLFRFFVLYTDDHGWIETIEISFYLDAMDDDVLMMRLSTRRTMMKNNSKFKRVQTTTTT